MINTEHNVYYIIQTSFMAIHSQTTGLLFIMNRITLINVYDSFFVLLISPKPIQHQLQQSYFITWHLCSSFFLLYGIIFLVLHSIHLFACFILQQCGFFLWNLTYIFPELRQNINQLINLKTKTNKSGILITSFGIKILYGFKDNRLSKQTQALRKRQRLNLQK